RRVAEDDTDLRHLLVEVAGRVDRRLEESADAGCRDDGADLLERRAEPIADLAACLLANAGQFLVEFLLGVGAEALGVRLDRDERLTQRDRHQPSSTRSPARSRPACALAVASASHPGSAGPRLAITSSSNGTSASTPTARNIAVAHTRSAANAAWCSASATWAGVGST